MNLAINIGLIATYILVGFAILVIVAFAIKALVTNIKDAIPSLVGVGVLVVLFLIALVISKSNDVSTLFFEKTGTNEAYSKLIGSGLITLYLIMAVVFATMIYFQIAKLLKR